MAASLSKREQCILGGVIIIVAIAIATCILFFSLQKYPPGNILLLPDIAPPTGWYAHHVDTINPFSFLIFTKDQVLPVKNATEGAAYGEQIDVDVATTTFSPADYIINEGFDGPAGKIFDSNWNTLSGHPLFTIRGEDAEGEDFKAEFLFTSSTVYNFELYPDDSKNYDAFDQIVNEVTGKIR